MHCQAQLPITLNDELARQELSQRQLGQQGCCLDERLPVATVSPSTATHNTSRPRLCCAAMPPPAIDRQLFGVGISGMITQYAVVGRSRLHAKYKDHTFTIQATSVHHAALGR